MAFIRKHTTILIYTDLQISQKILTIFTAKTIKFPHFCLRYDFPVIITLASKRIEKGGYDLQGGSTFQKTIYDQRWTKPVHV